MATLSGRRLKVSSLGRLRFILTTIFLFGGRYFLKKVHLLYLVPWKWRIHGLFSRGDAHRRLISAEEGRGLDPRVFRELLETLGPTFVKLGQILSLRPDFVGEELSRELSKLQSDVRPFAFEEVEQIIRGELGGAPGEFFPVLDRQPVAAASLAQVHRARLNDGTQVAVKVQRPDIRRTIDQDIDLLLYFAHLSERFVPEIRPYNPVRVAEEFADWTRRELDFAAEGHKAERFRYAFRDNTHIKIPAIYWEFTTSRILTMEYVEGVRADDASGIRDAGLDSRKLALYGVEAQLQQILIDGFFHADPHPGNSFALKGNVLCFYDFGMVGYLSETQRRELIGCFAAFADKNIEGFLDHFLHLARTSDASDLTGFRKDASEILSEMFFSPTNPSVAWIFFRLIHRGAVRRIDFPSDLALFSKALITTEAMGLGLYPDFDFNEHLVPFVQKTFEAYLDPSQLRRSFSNELIDYVTFFRDFPKHAQDMLRRLDNREPLDVRLDAHDIGLLEKTLKRQADRRLAEICLFAVAFLIAIGVLTGGRIAEGRVMLYAAVAFFVLVSLVFLRRGRRKG